jgi:tight adherence protein B
MAQHALAAALLVAAAAFAWPAPRPTSSRTRSGRATFLRGMNIPVTNAARPLTIGTATLANGDARSGTACGRAVWTGGDTSFLAALHRRELPVAWRDRPRWVVRGAAALAAVPASVLAGPVAGAIVGVYFGLGARAVLRRSADRTRAATRSRDLDHLCALAADLRAGLPPTGRPVGSTSEGAPITPDPKPEPDRLRQLVAALWGLAERTGAPVADLVERIEADARAMDRAHASAAAQAAGARATAWLLAGLPVGGIALGYGIGADPLQVLLHTPLGAACAGGAIALQLGGLAWSDRLSRAGGGSPR